MKFPQISLRIAGSKLASDVELLKHVLKHPLLHDGCLLFECAIYIDIFIVEVWHNHCPAHHVLSLNLHHWFWSGEGSRTSG